MGFQMFSQMGVPEELDGSFHGKSQSKMDDKYMVDIW